MRLGASLPLRYSADVKACDRLRALSRAAGRDAADVGIEVWGSLGNANPDEWRKEVVFWNEAGVTHVTARTTFASVHHPRIAGRSAAAQLAAIERFQDAVKELL